MRPVFALASAAVFFALLPAAVMAEEPVWTKGKVTKVKPEEGKVTIQHEEISNLDMPSMKMIFRVDDPELIAKLKPGQEGEFYFVKENGRFMVKQVKE